MVKIRIDVLMDLDDLPGDAQILQISCMGGAVDLLGQNFAG